jgi:hypothetical protein
MPIRQLVLLVISSALLNAQRLHQDSAAPVLAAPLDRMSLEEAMRQQLILIQWEPTETEFNFTLRGRATRRAGISPAIFSVPIGTVFAGSKSGAKFIALSSNTIDLSKQSAIDFSIRTVSVSQSPRFFPDSGDLPYAHDLIRRLWRERPNRLGTLRILR